MVEDSFEESKAFVGFGPEDVANIRALADPVQSVIPAVVRQFYETILQTPDARRVLRGGDQLARLRQTLVEWLVSVFAGPYDEAYHDARLRIGTTHVRVGLPQRYMLLAMDFLLQ
jgi:truncated hemoglobin YjbI